VDTNANYALGNLKYSVDRVFVFIGSRIGHKSLRELVHIGYVIRCWGEILEPHERLWLGDDRGTNSGVVISVI